MSAPSGVGRATAPESVLDQAVLHSAFSSFPSGVVAVCATVDGRSVGMAVSSFVPVSLDPPLVALCVRRESATWPVLRGCRRLGISVLVEGQGTIARKLASTAEDRFAGLAHSASSGGALAIDTCITFLNCSVERETEGGDHDIVILRVHTLRTRPSQLPLVSHTSRFSGVRHWVQPA